MVMGVTMWKTLWVAAFALLICEPACAERISIVNPVVTLQRDGRYLFQAVIIDHTLDLSNNCNITVRFKSPSQPMTVQCVKNKYQSRLPAGANITTVSTTVSALSPLPPGLGYFSAVWEADQERGTIQFCMIDAPNPIDDCVLVDLSR